MLGASSLLPLAVLALPAGFPLDLLPPGVDPASLGTVEDACAQYAPGVVDEALYLELCHGLPLATPVASLLGPAAPAVPLALPPPPAPERWRVDGVLDLAFVSFDEVRMEGTLEARDDALSPSAVRLFLAAQPAEARAALVETPARAKVAEAVAVAGARLERLDVHAEEASFDPAAPRDAPLRIAVSGDLAPHAAPEEGAERKARAALAAGGRLALEVRLGAPGGADLTYRLHPPAGLAFAEAAQDGLVKVRVDNRDGPASTARHVRLTLVDPDAPLPPARQDVRARVDVALGAPARGADGVPIALDLALEVRALDVPPGLLPTNLSLRVVGADGLRALHAAGALDEAALARAEETLLDALRAGLGAALPGANVTGGIARASLSPAEAGLPLRVEARAFGVQPVAEKEASDAELALALGASLSLDVPLPATGVPTTFVLHAPPGHLLVGAPPEGHAVAVGPEGGAASVVLRRADAPDLDGTDAILVVEVDVRRLDASGLLDGRSAELLLDVRASGILRAVELPAELRATLDPRVDLTHLDADGLRLLRSRGLLDDANVSALEGRILEEARRSFRDAFGSEPAVHGGFELASLEENASGPVRFEARATLRQPVLGGDGAAPTASIGLYSERRSFTLPRMEGFTTHYLLLMPEGFRLSGVEAEGGGATAQTIGGRDALILRPESERMTAHATLTVTSGYVAAHHAGAMAVLLFALLIAVQAPVAGFLFWRARRTAAAAAAAAAGAPEPVTPRADGP